MNKAFITFSQTKRFIVIDLYRTLAVFSVILFHINSSLFPNGWIGVDLFFVISGYLLYFGINRIDFESFFLAISSSFHFIQARFLRIYTPFIVFLPFTFFLSFSFLDKSAASNNILYLIPSSLFLSTPYKLIANKSYFEQNSIDLTSHLWSVSSEFFCYILFPIFLVLTFCLLSQRSRHQIVPLAIFFFLVFGFFLLFWKSNSYYNLGGKVIFFCIGSLAAFFHNSFAKSQRAPFHSHLITKSLSFFPLFALVSVSLVLFSPVSFSRYPAIDYLIPAIFLFSFASLSFNYDLYGFNRACDRPVFLSLLLLPGIYSLSFYLYHIPAIFLSNIISSSYYFDYRYSAFFALLITFITALPSAYFVEYLLTRFFLKKAHMFKYPIIIFFLFPILFYAAYLVLNKEWTRLIGTNRYTNATSCDRNFWFSSNSEQILAPACLVHKNIVLNNRTIFLVGDSHADVLFNVSTAFPFRKIIRLPLDGCSASSLIVDDPFCRRAFKSSLKYISSSVDKPYRIVLAFWVDSPVFGSTSVSAKFSSFISSSLTNFKIPLSAVDFVLAKPQSDFIVNDYICFSGFLMSQTKVCQSGYYLSPLSTASRSNFVTSLRQSGFSVFDQSDLLCTRKFSRLHCPHLIFSQDNIPIPISVDNHHLSSKFASQLISHFYH